MKNNFRKYKSSLLIFLLGVICVFFPNIASLFEIPYLDMDIIIEQNYTCNIENGFLNEINGMKSENIYEYFICLYVNNEVSNFGVADVYPNNGDVIKFKMTAVSELYG